jgi:hypothetical protein
VLAIECGLIPRRRDNYLSAKDTFLSTWSDNQLRQWLIDNGYIRSNAQVKRDELVKLASEKYVVDNTDRV